MNEFGPQPAEELPEPLNRLEVVQAIYRRVKSAQSKIDTAPLQELRLSILSGQLPTTEQFEAAIQASQDNGAYEALRDLYTEVNY